MSENVVRESLTLLRNQDNALPLSAAGQKILVVGPAADSLPNQCGGWSIHWQGSVSPSEFDPYPDTSTIYQGIKSLAPSGSNVQLVAACDFDKCDSSNLREIEAIIAASADVVVLAVGEGPEAEVLGDIDDLTISPSQIELIKTVHGAIAKSGRKVKTVMVLVEARPRIIPEELINATSAVINAYLPGPYAGTPLAEVLFGKANPSGKLPFTYPRTTGDIHVPYWHWYSDVTTPLFPFGFGLSYTTFAYDNLRVSDTKLAPGKPVTISVRVTNSGKVPGREVVQLYVSDVYATVAPSVKLLKRYVKTRSLAPGQSYVATFTLATHDLAFYNREQQFVAEAGLFNIQVGTLTSSFTLTGKSLICPAMKTATVWALLLALVIASVALTSGASAARNNARTAKRDAFVARLMASLTLKEKSFPLMITKSMSNMLIVNLCPLTAEQEAQGLSSKAHQMVTLDHLHLCLRHISTDQLKIASFTGKTYFVSFILG
ncbi:betaglucosidase [Acanthamoeba castellanii str. Neff]|uniref:beta-glucosidase n=1 Tax=Acanthamoeba castellanii (strain ATCC 30010 / Neff) TaxID=1257118 RepID=L8GX26_ACACF|nr:betaglucosidase [Acanthamoeba castellanii str. Neff]ELR17824.1 betaglucosidase [Acanthamoeba castellanii str. Neff]